MGRTYVGDDSVSDREEKKSEITHGTPETKIKYPEEPYTSSSARKN